MLWLNLFNIYIKFIKLALIWVQSHRFSSIRFEMTLNFRWTVQLLWWCKNCKNAFFKMNVFWNSYLRGAKKMKERNQSELDKIVFPELYNPFFRFNLSFFIAELHRFLWSLLAGYTLYCLILKATASSYRVIFLNNWVQKGVPFILIHSWGHYRVYPAKSDQRKRCNSAMENDKLNLKKVM